MMAFFKTSKQRVEMGERALECFLASSPLFLVTLRFWSGAVLILGGIACLAFLLMRGCRWSRQDEDAHALKILVILMLVCPVLAVFASSSFLGVHVLANYDSPSRFFLAVAVFLFALRRGSNVAFFLQYVAPLSVVLTLLHQVAVDQPMLWGAGRMSTYFADPLVFGYTSLTLGLISLTSINLLEKDPRWVAAFKFIGAGIGFYLSIKSGSRTGWLAVPLVTTIWLYRKNYVGGKSLHFFAMGATALLLLAAYSFSTTVQLRTLQAMHEVMEYPWTGPTPETSVGLRITFLRIALDMFAANPWVGIGDNGYDVSMLPASVLQYATPEGIRMAFHSGFHNEIVTNAVRFGVGGLLAAMLLFVIPLAVFLPRLSSGNSVKQANAMLGMVLTMCFFVSSLSTEVFDLKYMASFYAVMVSLLCASAIDGQAGNCRQYA